MAMINSFRWFIAYVYDFFAFLFQQLRSRTHRRNVEELQYHLHQSAYTHKVDSFQIHSRLNVDVNKLDDSGRTILHNVAGTFIRPMDISSWRRKHDEEILHEWITSGDENVSIVEFLLDEGANVNGTDSEGRTPLHLAVALFKEGLWHNRWACNNQLRVIETLLNHGANINAVDSIGRTPLHTAMFAINTRHKAPDMFLVEHISRITRILKNNNLFVSKRKNVDEHSERLVNILISRGADVNAVDINANTPWSLAIDFKRLHMRILTLLFDYGAHLDAGGKREYTKLWNFVSPPDDITPLYAVFQLNSILPLSCLCAHQICTERFTSSQHSHLSLKAIEFLHMHK